MNELITEVESYAAALGVKPQKVLRDALGAGWGEWASWCSGDSSPTMNRADRLRTYMEQNPSQVEAVCHG